LRCKAGEFVIVDASCLQTQAVALSYGFIWPIVDMGLAGHLVLAILISSLFHAL